MFRPAFRAAASACRPLSLLAQDAGRGNLRRFSCFIAALALLLGTTTAAFAHAHLTRAQPAAGSALKTAPTELTLSFSEALEAGFCAVRVTDEAGSRVDRDTVTADPADPKILHVALKPLPAGSYKIVWQVLSVDSHKADGKLSFEVVP